MKTTIIAIATALLFCACGVEEPAPPAPVTPVCGDDVCDEGEDCQSCPDDCEDPAPTPVCGDGKCETGETAASCAKDCYVPTCGDGKCETGETAANCAADCAPAPTYLPDPIKVAGKCQLLLSNYYVSGASCGELLGDLPGVNWSVGLGVNDTDGDGYLEAKLNASSDYSAGTYSFSWKGYTNCSAKLPLEGWAQYGGKAQLSQMSEDARKCIYCNWIDANGNEQLVDSPGCGGKVNIASDCTITCAGNAHLLKF